MIKRLLPYYIKVRLHLIKNGIIDIFNGNLFNYAKKRDSKINYIGNVEITQLIKQTATSSAKIKNFSIAIKRIETIEIKPNEIFSFWRVVRSPSKKNGFVESRSIVNGKLIPSYGGGLCQLSGLIYYICLYANLDIIERYNHSADIYTEETRFTPLGSDATVAYGYKDLKVRNNLKYPIKFTFFLDNSKLTAMLNCSKVVEKSTIEFKKSAINENEVKVITFVNREFKNESVYENIQSK